jgi:hypothetical protein
MKLDIDFSALEILVKNMGAPIVEWEPPKLPPPLPPDPDGWKITLKTKGIEINAAEIEWSPDGLASYKGEQILLYIKAYGNYKPKFHLYQCETLKDMSAKGQFKTRYVATQRKDGYFLTNSRFDNSNDDIEEKLDVCGYCRNWYNRSYQKRYTVENFDIAEFFEHFGHSSFIELPKYTDENAPADGYTTDWNEVSKQRREQFGYICQQCGIDLSSHKNLVQTHHINGVKSDNSLSNLKVLCVECHSLQANHEHMKISAANEILLVREIKYKYDDDIPF